MKAPAGLLFSVLWLIPSPLSVGLFVSEGEGEEEKGQPGGNATQRDRWADRLDSCHRSRCQQVPSESRWSWQRERHRAAGDSSLQLLSHLILPTNPHQLTSQYTVNFIIHRCLSSMAADSGLVLQFKTQVKSPDDASHSLLRPAVLSLHADGENQTPRFLSCALTPSSQ